MADAQGSPGQTSNAPLRVKIVPIPTKLVTLYPTVLLAGLVSLITWFTGKSEFWGEVFLFFAFVNFVVATFEFPRATVLTVILGVAAALLALYFINQWFGIVQWLNDFIKNMNLSATPQFYLFIFIGGL